MRELVQYVKLHEEASQARELLKNKVSQAIRSLCYARMGRTRIEQLQAAARHDVRAEKSTKLIDEHERRFYAVCHRLEALTLRMQALSHLIKSRRDALRKRAARATVSH
jgi:glutaredoxin 2